MEACGRVSSGRSARWPWPCARAASARGARGRAEAGGTRPDPRRRPRTLFRPPRALPAASVRGREGRWGPTARPRGAGTAGGRPGLRAEQGEGRRRRPRRAALRQPPRDAALKTTVNQAGVLPWKFYISVVYFFSNISGIVYRTFSHPTNVRLNRSENMKKRMTFQFRRSESKRYFLIIFLPECIVDLKFCHVQNILFFILTIYILYIF